MAPNRIRACLWGGVTVARALRHGLAPGLCGEVRRLRAHLRAAQLRTVCGTLDASERLLFIGRLADTPTSRHANKPTDRTQAAAAATGSTDQLAFIEVDKQALVPGQRDLWLDGERAVVGSSWGWARMQHPLGRTELIITLGEPWTRPYLPEAELPRVRVGTGPENVNQHASPAGQRCDSFPPGTFQRRATGARGAGARSRRARAICEVCEEGGVCMSNEHASCTSFRE